MFFVVSIVLCIAICAITYMAAFDRYISSESEVYADRVWLHTALLICCMAILPLCYIFAACALVVHFWEPTKEGEDEN